MRAVSSSTMNFSMLANVIADIHCVLCGLGRVSISCIKRGGNRVARELANGGGASSCCGSYVSGFLSNEYINDNFPFKNK